MLPGRRETRLPIPSIAGVSARNDGRIQHEIAIDLWAPENLFGSLNNALATNYYVRVA